MKNFKRLIAILITFVLVFSLAGCSGKKNESPSNETTPTGVADTATDITTPESTEITTIKISYPVIVVVPSEEGTKQVQDAVNDYLEKKGENVRVDLEPVDVSTYGDQMDMALASGEGVDIYCPFTGLTAAIATNQVLPLNDYLDNELKDTVSLMGEEWLKPSTYNGNVYAIPCYKGVVLEPYFICRKDIVDELGFDMDSIKSVKDIEPLLLQVKEKYPDMYPLVPTGGSAGGNTLMVDYSLNGVQGYQVDNFNYGASVVGDDLTVQNYYNTDFFKEACALAYDWNQKGLIMPDASLSSDISTDLLGSEQAFSVITGYGYIPESVEATYKSRCNGFDFYAKSLNKTQLTSGSLAVNWSIAYTCKNTQAAAKVLNLLYTDEYVLNSIIFGIEGTDYVKNDDGTISYPEGLDMNTVPYTAALSCGIVGNMFKQYALKGNTDPKDVNYMQQNNTDAQYSPAFGFHLDAANITSQCSAVDNIIQQYQYSLLCGEVDPEKAIPQFITALESAGINDIIAETQKQLDTWSTENK
jgi:putative aldouronate transport system substrate-binding protein